VVLAEFIAALKQHGFDAKNPEVFTILSEMMEDDQDSTISFKSFLELMTARVGEHSSRDELSRVYRLFDSQNQDTITLDTLKKISQEVGDNLSDEELKDILRRCDIDKDQNLGFEDFYTVITTKLH
jgi:Ca2+-binding EF-hand superfamily protein